MNENIALQKVTLRTLEPSIFNGLIVGVIIAKQEPRQFADSKNSQAGTTRAVLNFTLRDSLQDFINVTYWGKFEGISEVDENFHIGDVVEIIRPQITIRKFNDYGEQFRPKVTSPFSLIMNDLSNILHHEGGDVDVYKNLLRLPTKPPGFVPIRDLHNGGLAIKETFADVLGAVASPGRVRTVKLKNGGEGQVIEVILFDQTHPGIRLSIWNKEYMNRAPNWKPRETVIFITDVKVDWSGFHKTIVATFSSRSILTENPVGREAENLARYAKTAKLEPPNVWNQFDIPDVDKIQNVMSVQQIQNRLEIVKESIQNVHFTALIYAVVTQLDLDGFTRLVTKKCNACKSLIKNTDVDGKCENQDCPVGRNQEFCEAEYQFDIRMSVCDHTGDLSGCRLTGKTAEMVLGCSVHDFMQMSDADKAALKWKYLLERCAVRVFVYFDNYQRPVVSVQGCSLADSIEVAERIPVY